MASLVRMPEIAANAESATLLSWEVEPGASVREGDTLALIETDKATVDLLAEHDGTLSQTLVRAGQAVNVGAPVAVLLKAGETDAHAESLLDSVRITGPSSSFQTASPQETSSQEASSQEASFQTASSQADRMPVAAMPVETGAIGDASGIQVQAIDADPGAKATRASTREQARIFASPLARRMAAEQGIDLRDLPGSGPNGRIVKRDVVDASQTAFASSSISQPALQSAGPTHVQSADTPRQRSVDQNAGNPDTITRIPHSNMRKTIARRLAQSKSTIPHFYLDVDCRAEALLTLRNQINHSVDGKISINDFVIKAVACALRDMPEMNVTWTDDALLRYRDVDIGVAVSTEGGLYTPVLRDVAAMSLTEVSRTMAELARRARAGQLAPQEYQGGVLSISNLGMFGVARFGAIINPPQSAILAVGAVQRIPVAVDDQVRIEPVLKCTLSVDHRAIDGALAAQWLSRYRHYIEHPWAMLV